MTDIQCIGVVDQKGVKTLVPYNSIEEFSFKKESLDRQYRANIQAKIFKVGINAIALAEIKDLIQFDPKMAESVISKYPTFNCIQ